MRKNHTITFIFIALLFSVWSASGGALAADRGTTKVTLAGKTIKIDYGRPELRGRDVMTMAAPGTVWRMGMDAATQLDAAATLKFEGLTVKPGTYTLFAKKVSADEWRLIVNKKTGIWGTDHDASADLGSTPLKSSTLQTPVEAFTIVLSGSGNKGTLEMHWGTRKLSTTFAAE